MSSATRPRLLVTIMQHKRVGCPFLFINHILPGMRSRDWGEIDVVLIQHLADVRGKLLESSRHGAAGMEKVAAWTKAGCFPAVEVVQHTECFPPYPSIPSYRIAAEHGIAGAYDLHLWLEDDALVYDPEFTQWGEKLAAHEVGEFYEGLPWVHSSSFVSRPEFDRRIAPLLQDLERWQSPARRFVEEARRGVLVTSRIEPFLQAHLTTGKSYLGPHAARHHPYRNPRHARCELQKLQALICRFDPSAELLHVLEEDCF
jgi:hypothetical protein